MPSVGAAALSPIIRSQRTGKPGLLWSALVDTRVHREQDEPASNKELDILPRLFEHIPGFVRLPGGYRDESSAGGCGF
jgi:hypothetical protein